MKLNLVENVDTRTKRYLFVVLWVAVIIAHSILPFFVADPMIVVVSFAFFLTLAIGLVLLNHDAYPVYGGRSIFGERDERIVLIQYRAGWSAFVLLIGVIWFISFVDSQTAFEITTGSLTFVLLGGLMFYGMMELHLRNQI